MSKWSDFWFIWCTDNMRMPEWGKKKFFEEHTKNFLGVHNIAKKFFYET